MTDDITGTTVDGSVLPRLMIVVGSVRPGRVGLPIAQWARSGAQQHGGFSIDFADLAEIDLPMMDEPNHPKLRNYAHPHTIAWSERVSAADAFIFVTPEYNYSFSAALKNALDYLNVEWWMKPIGFISYGGISSGTRGAAALMPVLVSLGLVRVPVNVELHYGATRVRDGAFHPTEAETAALTRELDELRVLARPLAAVREAFATI